MKCSACGQSIDKGEGVELWGSRFCSACFVSRSSDLHRELGPEDLARLRAFSRELAGLLPKEPLDLVAIGFYRRVTGKTDLPPPEELERFAVEIQRLVCFSVSRKTMNLLQTLRDEIVSFTQGQEEEIRETIRRLTEP